MCYSPACLYLCLRKCVCEYILSILFYFFLLSSFSFLLFLVYLLTLLLCAISSLFFFFFLQLASFSVLFRLGYVYHVATAESLGGQLDYDNQSIDRSINRPINVIVVNECIGAHVGTERSTCIRQNTTKHARAWVFVCVLPGAVAPKTTINTESGRGMGMGDRCAFQSQFRIPTIRIHVSCSFIVSSCFYAGFA